MKIFETLENDLQHPEHPELVLTIRKPDLFTRTELFNAIAVYADPKKVEADFRKAVETITEALTKVVVNIRGLDGMSYAEDPLRVMRALVAGPQPLTFPGPEVEGRPTREALLTVVFGKVTDDAFFGLDPEGKASPAPLIDS
jgi:hypothetical protein